MSDSLPPLQSHRSTAQEIAELQKYLDKEISPKRDGSRNLLIATWNLKEFGSLTDRWLARATDRPKRDYRALWAITEIVSRFDIVALQEVGGDLKALRTMLKTLGEDWHFLITDRTKGNAGGGERLAFVFDSRRVTLSGLACELVVPDELLKPGQDETGLSRQFARTPYAVGFRAGGETIILVTLHICYGTNLDVRRDELHAIARWMADWARETTLFEQNLIALGDFNIDRQGSPLYDAFVHSGLSIPKDLENVERSIFARDAKRLDKYYDQIAWFTDGGERQLKLRYVKGGKIEFTNYLYRDLDLSRSDLQYRVSDHYPLWVEFECRHISKIKAEQNRRKTRKHARTRTTVPHAGTDSPAMVTGAEGGADPASRPRPTS